MIHEKIAFIGAGHMASYIIKGLILANYPPEKIIATRRTEAPLKHLEKKYNIQTTTKSNQAVLDADIVVLGVKPHAVQDILEKLRPVFQNKKPLLISIAAGTPVHKMEAWSNDALPIIRAMPNLPVAVQSGVTCLYASNIVSDAQKKITQALFESMGVVCWFSEEDQMDISVVPGGAPALFYRFIESLSKAVVSMGIDEHRANKLIVNTGVGALKLLCESKESPETLRKHVTSPNGTTEAALNVLEAENFDDLLKKALQSSVAKSIEMAKET